MPRIPALLNSPVTMWPFRENKILAPTWCCSGQSVHFRFNQVCRRGTNLATYGYTLLLVQDWRSSCAAVQMLVPIYIQHWLWLCGRACVRVCVCFCGGLKDFIFSSHVHLLPHSRSLYLQWVSHSQFGQWRMSSLAADRWKHLGPHTTVGVKQDSLSPFKKKIKIIINLSPICRWACCRTRCLSPPVAACSLLSWEQSPSSFVVEPALCGSHSFARLCVNSDSSPGPDQQWMMHGGHGSKWKRLLSAKTQT